MKKLYTRWGKNLNTENVLQEYPRPLMKRKSYINLNGYWDYAITSSLMHPETYDGRILVPFSPESLLSGVERQLKPDEFLWYSRTFQVTDIPTSESLLLHFGAVDQACKIYVNGQRVCRHTGGYLPFHADITPYIKEGDNEIQAVVQDLSDTSYHARGKQKLKSAGMFYTAQSGIWQTVWMEWVPKNYIQNIKCTPLYDSREVEITVTCNNRTEDSTAAFTIEGHDTVYIPVNTPVKVAVEECHPWTPDTPYLYSCKAEYREDSVESYFAMRTLTMEPDSEGIPRLCLNHTPIFMKGVLDQGYWSDGLYTAPSDEAFIFDIKEMKKLGFNVIRKHIKIEPQRWYYHCDRLGMLVWQDMVSGGDVYKHWYVTYLATVLSRFSLPVKDSRYGLLSRRKKEGRKEFRKEIKETIQLLYNHPSICTWVLFNEGWGQFDAKEITSLAQAEDTSRWIDQASGWFDQGGGHIKSIHNYFFPLKFKREAARACVLSEFGGYSLNVEGHVNCRKEYGYRSFKDIKQLNHDYGKLMKRDLLRQEEKGLCGGIYTQLSDVEDETNGIFTFDREVKKIVTKI